MSRGQETENIYTSLPRFVAEPVRRTPLDPHLPPVLRDFEWDGRRYIFIISPATVYRDGIGEKQYYPGERERLIELGLRELAVSENPSFLDEENSLCFSFSQLRRELDELTGDSVYSDHAVKDGLDILADAKYEIHYGVSELCVRPIEQLTVREKDGETYYLAKFSSLFLHRNEVFDFCFGRRTNPAGKDD